MERTMPSPLAGRVSPVMETTVRHQPDPATEPSRRPSRSQGFVSLGLVVAIMSGVLVAVLGGGEVANHVELQPGGAWLASTNEMVHVNGAAATADGTVALPGTGKGSGLDIVERAGAVYAVDRDKDPPHWYRIRAATQTIETNGDLDLSSDLQLVTSPQGTYAIDRRGTVRAINRTRPGPSLHLPAPLGQAAVDATGTVWVPTGAGTIVAIRDGKPDKPVHIGTRRARLDAIAIGGRIAILDTTRSRLVPLDPRGRPGTPIDLGALQGAIRIPETVATGNVVFLVDDAGATATMIRVDLTTRTVTPAPLDAADPSPIQIAGPHGYLVDRANGTIFQVDVATGGAERLDRQPGFQGPAVDVTVRAGIVYINNPDTDQALVIGTDGNPRRVNKRKITPPKPREVPATTTTVSRFGSNGSTRTPPPPRATVPGAPQPQSVSSTAPRELTLTWSAAAPNGSAVTRYDAECTTSGGTTGRAGTGGTGSSVPVRGLDDGLWYTCTVRATNAVGQGSPGTFQRWKVDSRVPEAVANLQAEPGNQRVTLTFAPLTDEQRNGAIVDGYRAECTSADPGAGPGSADVLESATNASVSGLRPTSPYTCRVRALSARTQTGAIASADATPFGPPAITPNSSADGNTVTVEAQIDNQGSPVTSCSIRNNQSGGSGDCLGGSADFSDLDYATGYTFTVSATNAAATVASTTDAVTTGDPPDPQISKSGRSAIGAPLTDGTGTCAHASCEWIAIVAFATTRNGIVSVSCYSTVDTGGLPWKTINLQAGNDRRAYSDSSCFHGFPGYTVYVRASITQNRTTESNHITW